MIKKISLALILFCMLISCGKKGDPEYEDLKKKAKTQSFLINKI
tara:strand:+ start:264 stop:395 length:132 start_codon:yes stop_codon:yes gene_type:complete